ncbi:MAG TPA: hypothetical protein EYG54_06005 [Myxococcales bacterium]|nr:hypothetical protein [Myxococcales bacterium]
MKVVRPPIRNFGSVSFGIDVSVPTFISQATRCLILMESLHLQPRRKPQLDFVVYEATPLFVVNDLHEITILALQVGATIQALYIMQKAMMAMMFGLKGCSNPEATQGSLGITVYTTEHKDRVDHHLSLFLPKVQTPYTTPHEEAMKRFKFQRLSGGISRKMSIRRVFIRRAPRRD